MNLTVFHKLVKLQVYLTQQYEITAMVNLMKN